MAITIELAKTDFNDGEKIDQAIDRGLTLTALDTIRFAKQLTPVDHGRAQGAWVSEKTTDKTVEISNSAEYIDYLDQGTGIYGPKKQQIVPISGKVLAFKPPRGWGNVKSKSGLVFFKSVKGIRPYNIYGGAVKQVDPRVEGLFLKAFTETIK